MSEINKRHAPMSSRAGKLLAAITSTALLMTGFAAGTPVFAQVHTTTPAALSPLKVVITRSDTTPNPSVGTTLRFNIRVTNPNAQTIGVLPVTSNLDGVLPTACRWRNLKANDAFNCFRDVAHTVTPEDVARGSFTPEARFDIYDGPVTNRLLEGVSIPGEAVPLSPAPPTQPAGAPFEITWTRIDDLGDAVYVGDLVRYRLNVRNTSSNPVAAIPSASTLDNAIPPASGNCRYSRVDGNANYDCNSVVHVITDEDLARGSFTPSITIDAKTPGSAQNLIAAGIPSTTTPVRVVQGMRPDPSLVPTDRPAGEPVALATNFRNGFECYRIPALTSTNDGTLLAAWDGRPGTCADAPNPNSIVQRISRDGGKSWEAPKVIAAGKRAEPKYGYSDPSYVVDRETGDIFMHFVKSYDVRFQDSREGSAHDKRDVIHTAFIKSSDNGQTWSEPKVITEIVDGPGWSGRFAASGEGIQKQHAPHKGRLIQQFTIKASSTYKAVSVYSDDHGKTWKAGNTFGTQMDENKVVELADGRLMVNSRSSNNRETGRKIAFSTDGGENYSEPVLDNNLVDPRNNASIIRAFPDAPPSCEASKWLLFSNTKSRSGRRNGTIRLSKDEGATWDDGRAYEASTTEYSTLTHLRDANGVVMPGKYGLLYEKDYFTVRYTNIDAQWLGFEVPECAKPTVPIVPPRRVPGPQQDISTSPGGDKTIQRVAGASRVETAAAISAADFPKGAEVIVLARADVHADSVSGVALADELNAPVLLTPSDGLHDVVAKEVQRLQPKGGRVIIMGGEVAISRGVEEALVKLGAKPERVAGPNRAATAVATAKVLGQLNKATQVLVADGAGWEASLIAGPVAASVDGVTLLTNGDKMAPETAEYLKDNKVPVTTIGAKAKAALPGQKAIEGADASALSVNVANTFFKAPKAVGFATTATFADALTGGVHIGRKHSPLLLIGDTAPESVATWFKDAKSVEHLYVYGGPARISEEMLANLTK